MALRQTPERTHKDPAPKDSISQNKDAQLHPLRRTHDIRGQAQRKQEYTCQNFPFFSIPAMVMVVATAARDAPLGVIVAAAAVVMIVVIMVAVVTATGYMMLPVTILLTSAMLRMVVMFTAAMSMFVVMLMVMSVAAATASVMMVCHIHTSSYFHMNNCSYLDIIICNPFCQRIYPFTSPKTIAIIRENNPSRRKTMIILLIQKILSLAFIMGMGAAVVRLGILHSEDSQVLSKLCLYLIMPCMILSAFQVDYTEEVKNGLLLVFFAAVLIMVLLIAFGTLTGKWLHLDNVEAASVIYSNAGNIIIPMVTAMLGKEWVIYTSGLILVQIVLLFTHANSMLARQKGFAWKTILTNPNIIAIAIGVVLFFTRIRLPGPIGDTVDSMGSMVGPVSMLVTGMLIGGMDFKQIFAYRRIWLVSALRLVISPLLILVLLKYSGIANLVADGRDILLVTFLATTTPSGNTITHLALVHNNDAPYASAISVVTTLMCIVTIPIMVLLYQL